MVELSIFCIRGRFVLIVLFYLFCMISIVCCNISEFLASNHGLSFEELCFIEALRETQSCSNNKILYVTTLGCCQSGFGSEFNLYLISSILTSVAKHRRMVYYKFKRTWEYDCQSESSWACYFSFPCDESGISEEQLDYSQAYMGVNRNADATLWRPNMTHIRRLQPRNKEIYDSINSRTIGSQRCNVNFSSLSVTTLTALTARFLYRLNDYTVEAVRNINHQFANLRAPYLSLQLRLTDKHFELGRETWRWLNNVSNTVAFIRPYFQQAATTRIYIASDSCSAVHKIVALLPEYEVFGPCLNSSNRVIYERRARNSNTNTYALLADIEMLRGGAHFFGIFDSNLVRMVHRLRHPNLSSSHCLAAETYRDARRNINDNMRDLGNYYDS